jgi:hypothetical protein
MWFSAALLLLVAVSAQAQDSKPPFEWKTSGDTVETFKAELKLNTAIDQSTPEGTVNGFSLLTDGRDEHREAFDAVSEKAYAAIDKSVDPLFEKLLSEELNKSRLDARAESRKKGSSSYKSGATTIVSVTEGKDGAKLVETLQKNSWMNEEYDPETGEKTGKMKEEIYENKGRYTLIKGEDGKWRIDSYERMQKNWEKMDDMGNAPEEWVVSDTMLSWLMQKYEPAKTADLKQDTAEAAAQALFNCVFPKRDNWERQSYASAQESWLVVLKPLHTENAIKAAAAKDGEGKEGEAEIETGDSGSREVDKVTDGAEGVKQVKFKARTEWSSPMELHVKKTGDVWKVVKVGVYDKDWENMDENGNAPEKFREITNVEELRWQ